MKFIKDKKIIALISILFVFTIAYFIIINHISFAFSDKYDVNESYNILINTIQKCATAYAEKNPDLFKTEKTVYIKVQDLIDNNLLIANSDGLIINPLDPNSEMNSNIIKLKTENDKIVVSVDS